MSARLGMRMRISDLKADGLRTRILRKPLVVRSVALVHSCIENPWLKFPIPISSSMSPYSETFPEYQS